MAPVATLLAAVAAGAGPNRSVAVLVQDGFYLLDALGPLNLFRIVGVGGELCVNLTSHEWHDERPCPIPPPTGSVAVDLLAVGPSTTVVSTDR